MLTEAIVGHLVGDYLLQNDYAAMRKKQSSFACAVHCTFWTAAVCLFAGLGWGSAAILFATHFAQDRGSLVSWWMDTIGQKQFRTGPLAPWSTIVVDNVLHIVTIYAVVKLLGGM